MGRAKPGAAVLAVLLAACGGSGDATTLLDEPAGSRATTAVSTVQQPLASADPSAWMAEIEELSESAGPGRISGFVSLAGETSTGAPNSPNQPVCVGAGAFSDVAPGAPIAVLDPDGTMVGESILRGSAYDAHLGCTLWFAAEVPEHLETYELVVAGHSSGVIGRGTLEEFGWIVNLWSNESSMLANCIELEPDAEPMTCIPID